MTNRICLLTVISLLLTSASDAQDPFATQVRPSEPLTPAAQQQSFELPPGFRIDLFASEPDIQKPLNMAFDARGRLWVTSSVEYPFAAEPGQGRDRIQILEDTDGDGRADRKTVFADDLNIPIGLYPYRDGVVVYSIPNILFLRDTDGDGQADQREVLYGPLGIPRDTHGMQNAFRRGFDGWLYICHGFSNESQIEGRDGSRVTLQSGNTYRVKLDGSRVEQFTHGQVNPFGSTWTPWGDLITADCHSKPLTLLLRGGYYSSFGKPHDGLGFVPPIMDHGHGSTAISGAAYCSSPAFPPQYQGHLFVGNVMTSRINHDRLVPTGSSVRAVEQPDFVASRDPWFRPVDLRFGPDGALYVADFYNRIIGHYEVALTHPERDRTRGRIWRISYDGPAAAQPPRRNLAQAPVDELIRTLDDPQLVVRQLATDQLTDRIGAPAAAPLRDAVIAADAPETRRVHALWALFRIAPDAIDQPLLDQLDESASDLIKTHLLRVLTADARWSDQRLQLAQHGLRHENGHVQRAAAEVFSVHPGPTALEDLVRAWQAAPAGDFLAKHMLKIAIRHQLRPDGALPQFLADTNLSTAHRTLIAQIALGLPTADSARFLMAELQAGRLPQEQETRALQHIVKHLSPDELATAIVDLRRRTESNLGLQLQLLDTISNSLSGRVSQWPPPLQAWASELATQLLNQPESQASRWSTSGADNPWGLELRNCRDGQRNIPFLSSLPGGENRTGTIRSAQFKMPPRLSFFLCGHLGFPQNEATPHNRVLLRLAENDQVLAAAVPPRNDTAVQIVWEVPEHQGADVYVEVVDGLSLSAYAWLAVSRFEPEVIKLPSISPRQTAQRLIAGCRLVAQYQLRSLTETVRQLATQRNRNRTVVVAAVESLQTLEPRPSGAAMLELMRESSADIRWVRTAAQALAARDQTASTAALKQAVRYAPQRVQSQMALRLAADRQGGQLLLRLVESGEASPRLLLDPNVLATLRQSQAADIDAHVAKLTAGLPPQGQLIEQQIRDTVRQVLRNNPNPAHGRALFQKHCAACHQIKGQGGLVGPQLDGIGGRGVERIAEDLIDPNRNVDRAFRTTVLALNDGRVVLGLKRRTEDDTLVLADQKGQEFKIPHTAIDEQSTAATSIMPANFAEVVPTTEIADLVAYLAAQRPVPPTDVDWDVRQLDRTFRAEGVAVADVNRDGKLDVLTGEVWYAAPDWKRHEIATPGDYGDGAKGYSQCFACFADDVDQDGWPDLVSIGFPGAACHWFKNPQGADRHWDRFEIWHSACNETPQYADLFGDGKRVLIMGWQSEGKQNEGQLAWFAPGEDVTKPWVMHPISRPSEPDQPVPGTHRFAHGLGTGDVDADGRTDVMCAAGWWEQPEPSRLDRPWTFHRSPLGPACADMHTLDIDLDGRPDVVTSSAHGFGIWWHQRQPETAQQMFARQDLFPDLVSQTHALQVADINGDKVPDLVTGKRWWAHGPNGDPGSDQPAMLYWFEGRRSKQQKTLQFIPRPIHSDSGIGTQFVVSDLNQDGLLDIVTSNKKGVHIALQQRNHSVQHPTSTADPKRD